jgi:hypothetical protein
LLSPVTVCPTLTPISVLALPVTDWPALAPSAVRFGSDEAAPAPDPLRVICAFAAGAQTAMPAARLMAETLASSADALRS